MRIILQCLLFCSCVQEKNLPVDLDESIEVLLAEDRANKLMELGYLEDIRVAQENNDSEAFRYYLQEYIAVPRLEISEHLKDDPRYFVGGKSINY